MKERREYIRLGEYLKVAYKILDSKNAQSGSLVEDISGGGIRLPVKNRLWPGAVLELEITLPGVNEPVKASGEVVWFQVRNDADYPFVVGIKFINIDPFERGKILNYIRKRIEEKSGPDIEWLE